MSEEFGPDFITVTDEDGNEFELEHLDTLEHEGETYMAFSPAAPLDDGSGRPADEAGDEDYGIVILKVIHEGDEELFSTPDSDEELDAVYQRFMERFFDEEEEEEE